MATLRVERLIISLDTALPLACCWDDCDRRARTPYQVIVHEHPAHLRCSHVDQAGGAWGRHMHYAFCSEHCLDYYEACTGTEAHMTASQHRGRIYGMASAGAPRRYR